MKKKLINLFMVFFIFLPSLSHGSVTIFDIIAIVNQPIMIMAQTKGRFFHKGGILVDFFVDKKHLGKNMSGGDGYAFLEYTPKSIGIKNIEVKSGEDKDTGKILVMRKNEKVVLIEIEGGLTESILSFKLKKNSRDALKGIISKYRIIYFTTMFGMNVSRKFVEDNDIPSSVILNWRGYETLEEIEQLGINIHAIIGSQQVINEASDYTSKSFSFEETDDENGVEDWDEILKRLNIEKKVSSHFPIKLALLLSIKASVPSLKSSVVQHL